MIISGLRLRRCAAELKAPMRSRGDVGYREYFHTGSERQRLDVVEILTDAGARGITLVGGGAPELPEFLERVALPALHGQDWECIPTLRRRLREGAAAAGEPFARVARSAINRLEFGLWDLAARGAGLPLWRYLGGPAAAPVRVYAGGGSLCWNPLELLVEEVRQLVARGFTALKIKIGHGPGEDAALIRDLRAAAGPDVRIMVDANRAYDLAGALQLCPVLNECGIYWFEEPFVYDDPEPWRQLRARTQARVTGGEGFARILQAANALQQGMLEILQCDAGGFGLEALLATAAMAEEEGAALTPHCCNSAIGFAVAAHLQLAIPNAEIQEFETFDSPFIHSIFNEPFDLAEGCLCLPPGPGIGYTLNEQTVERYRVA
jgi:D-galactarolactone cycloisomerase